MRYLAKGVLIGFAVAAFLVQTAYGQSKTAPPVEAASAKFLRINTDRFACRYFQLLEARTSVLRNSYKALGYTDEDIKVQSGVLGGLADRACKGGDYRMLLDDSFEQLQEVARHAAERLRERESLKLPVAAATIVFGLDLDLLNIQERCKYDEALAGNLFFHASFAQFKAGLDSIAAGTACDSNDDHDSVSSGLRFSELWAAVKACHDSLLGTSEQCISPLTQNGDDDDGSTGTGTSDDDTDDELVSSCEADPTCVVITGTSKVELDEVVITVTPSEEDESAPASSSSSDSGSSFSDLVNKFFETIAEEAAKDVWEFLKGSVTTRGKAAYDAVQRARPIAPRGPLPFFYCEKDKPACGLPGFGSGKTDCPAMTVTQSGGGTVTQANVMLLDPTDNRPVTEFDAFNSCLCKALRSGSERIFKNPSIKGSIAFPDSCGNQGTEGRMACFGVDDKPQMCSSMAREDIQALFDAQAENACHNVYCPALGRAADAAFNTQTGDVTCNCGEVPLDRALGVFAIGEAQRRACANVIQCPGEELFVRGDGCGCP